MWSHFLAVRIAQGVHILQVQCGECPNFALPVSKYIPKLLIFIFSRLLVRIVARLLFHKNYSNTFIVNYHFPPLQCCHLHQHTPVTTTVVRAYCSKKWAWLEHYQKFIFTVTVSSMLQKMCPPPFHLLPLSQLSAEQHLLHGHFERGSLITRTLGTAPRPPLPPHDIVSSFCHWQPPCTDYDNAAHITPL
jgi:hypothetical protein